MLPLKVRANSLRAITLIWDERFESLRQTLTAVNIDCIARGLAYSASRIDAITKELTAEAAGMADAICHAICDVYEAVGCVVEDSHRDELKSMFDEAFRHPETQLSEIFDIVARTVPLPGNLPTYLATHRFGADLRPTFSHLRNKQRLAIDMYIDRRLHRSVPPSGAVTNTISIGGSVGIFQTGQGAVANIEGGLNQNEQSAALAALTQAITAIIQAPARPSGHGPFA